MVPTIIVLTFSVLGYMLAGLLYWAGLKQKAQDLALPILGADMVFLALVFIGTM